MKVIVLAAGRSRRIQPIADKNLLSFLGRPLLEHQLDQIVKAGFEDIIVVAGAHNLPAFRALCKSFGDKKSNISLTIVEQKNLDEGMAGAILAAQDLVGDEPMLVINANDVVDIAAYQQVLEASQNRAFDSYLLAKKVEQYFPGGYLEIAEEGANSMKDANRITRIVEKPGEGNEPSDLVNIVVHFHRQSTAFFEALQNVQTEADDKYEVAMDQLIRSGMKMQALPYEGFWRPLKYPWHVLDVMDHFLEQLPPFDPAAAAIAQNIEIAPSAVIRGNVFLEPGVRIFDHATIIGPAYLGENVVVANGSLVRHAHIGANSVIGFGSEIARSYLGGRVWTHTNYIGDSIIGNNVSFGSGSVTGNLRFDEGPIASTIQGNKVSSQRNKFGLVTGDHVRCGVNTSFMPGIHIGSNSCIGAGLVIAENIDPNTYVTGKMQLEKRQSRLDIAAIDRSGLQQKLQS